MRVPGPYFVAAPTRSQVKRIYWNDLKQLSLCSLFPDKPSESELTIKYPNGSTLSLVGLDEPQRIEGSYWMGGVVDEIADVRDGAWEENISPALDTVNPLIPDYRPWCWLIGVPDGLNHYYDLAEYAKSSNDPDWKLYTWKSSDILPPDVIEAAKRRMSPRQYRQEYEASFETAAGKIYEDYGNHNFTTQEVYKLDELLWCHDFNFTPMSSAICVRAGNTFNILDEIILTSATSRQSALEFVDRFERHENKKVTLYGDPAGRAGEKHGHPSDYTEMEKVLREAGWTVKRKVKNAAPAIRDRQNAVRAKILNVNNEVSLKVNTKKCPYVHKGLATVQLKEGSTFLEKDSQYQHITTAIGYMIDYECPVTHVVEEVVVTPERSKNFYRRSA
jgi:hypothetical protein